MKSKIQLLVVAIAAVVVVMNLASCTSYHGIASKPDGHNRYRPDFTLLTPVKHHSSDHYKQKAADTKVSASNTTKAAPAAPATVDAKKTVDMSSLTASAGNDVPNIKNPKDLYKLLTTEERAQAKEEVNKVLAKRPILKSLVNGRLNKLDKQYPAPAQSSFSKDGGSLSIGEILAIVAAACVVTFFLALAGLIIGIVALQKIKNEGGANWARILSIVAIALGALFFFILLIWIIVDIAVLHVVFL
jgi:hypothetical protein